MYASTFITPCVMDGVESYLLSRVLNQKQTKQASLFFDLIVFGCDCCGFLLWMATEPYGIKLDSVFLLPTGKPSAFSAILILRLLFGCDLLVTYEDFHIE
jgi:hypothetical protein